jgi:hypothetical protein
VSVAAVYACGDEQRRAAVRKHNEDGGALNGIDFLEVLDRQLLGLPGGGPLRQKILLVRLFLPVPAGFDASRLRLEGGVRVPVRVLWARPVAAVTAPEKALVDAVLTGLPAAERGRILVVRTDANGDASTYRLRLVRSATDARPPEGFDPRLSAVDFSFKVECESDFDCRRDAVCAPAAPDEPELGYLAKDYGSFRRLMLDRLSAIAPDWRERNPADLGIALVELLAYVGDQLSYYQDAVATEAYLGTARKRISVRRHARLVDYFLHEGSNARAWIAVTAGAGGGGVAIPAGTPVVSRGSGDDLGDSPVLLPEDLERALAAGAVVFETLHPLTLRLLHDAIPFYTWSDRECCLPAGSTAATLAGELPDLAPGALVLFEEIVGPKTGQTADADPRRRHVVRLTRVERGSDPLNGRAVADVEWDAADALPFPLCLSAVTDDDHGSVFVEGVSVARANVLLADHGVTVEQPLGTVPENPEKNPFRPVLAQGPVTWAVPLPDGFAAAPAALLAQGAPRDARPAVELRVPATDERWTPRRDLLASDRFATDFVLEVEEDGRAWVRFGDDTDGKSPAAGTLFTARYRVGNGPAGNVGAGVLRHLVLAAPAGIENVSHPLPAFGGASPESLEEARQYAPQAFRVQQRAVTEADYAAVAERHPEVQRAAATFRWTGSWITVFLTVDRIGGRPVDADFERRLRLWMERFRMAGHDLEIDAPRFVPLDLALHVCVAAGHFRSQVKGALVERLGRFFHPDEWTFGQPVWLSRIYAAAAEVEGIDSVEVVRFQRQGRTAERELEDGVLRLARLEIARLDNDPNFRENGRLELALEGGR